jgi:SulP family sulfate permease
MTTASTTVVSRPWWRRALPMQRWWPMVDRESLRADALAGLSGAVILVPQAVAYASIAGLPPEYGLYTAIVPVIIAALFGSSWHLVSGPTAAISIVVFATISPLAAVGSAAYVNLVLTLTFMVGVLTLAMSLARLGSLVNFVSQSVVVGFTAGAAILIATSQLKNFLGLAAPASSSFLGMLDGVFQQFGHLNPYATLVGAVTLATGLLSRRLLPRLPYMISAMVVGSLFAQLLQALLGPAARIATVAAVPSALPPLSMPDWSPETFSRLASVAPALTVLALTEALALARAVALKSGQRIDGNHEFLGQGLANLAGSFFSSYVSSGSFTRSGVNYSAGARTPMAAVFSSVCLVAILLLLAPAVRFLPIASMAAILFMVAYSLIDLHHIRVILRASRTESAVLAATLLATLFLHLEIAIYVGVALSVVLFLGRTAQPRVRHALPAPGAGAYHYVDRDGRPECPQLRSVFIDGPIYFGAVDHVQRLLRRIDDHDPDARHLMVLAPGIGFVDLSGAELLAQEARRRKALGGGLYFHRMQQPVRETLEKAGYLRDIGTENLFVMGEDVMHSLYPRLDPEICRSCKLRVFSQCHAALPNGEPRAHPSLTQFPAAPPSGHASTASPKVSRLSDPRARSTSA